MSRIAHTVPQEWDRKQLEEAVEEELELFNTFFVVGLGNEKLAPSEKAILKTYLAWRLIPQLKEEGSNAPLPPV